MPGAEFFGAEERKELMDVMETGILFRYNHESQRNSHWKARDFEIELARFNGVKYAHVVTSGSTAVATAMAAAGIGLGDEVIVPTFTYIATIEGALLGGAVPIFCDIDETLCLSPKAIEKLISPKTKAIVLVQMCGAMAKMDEILAICQKHNLMLLEDSAQALGASYKGKAIGTFGQVGCFSFDFFKIITAGEGGAIITDSEAIYNNAQMFADHGHDHIGNNRGAENHPIMGFNYRISELHAAVGLAQLRKINKFLELNRKHKASMTAVCKEFPAIELRHYPDPDGDSATFLSFFLPSEALARQTVAALIEHKVGELTGIQYWYDNNYHYIKNWQHLKEMKFPMKIHYHQANPPQDLMNLDTSVSDNLMSRLISLVVKVGWESSQLEELCRRMRVAFSQVLG
jgi:8-amino-3,8-dideoxy-alpha-D-manno-octulosonate transaminase